MARARRRMRAALLSLQAALVALGVDGGSRRAMDGG
jgi:hypothetical protein